MNNFIPIIGEVSRMSVSQRNSIKAKEAGLEEDVLKVLKKGKEFIDDSAKIKNKSDAELIVKLLAIYTLEKSANKKNQ